MRRVQQHLDQPSDQPLPAELKAAVARDPGAGPPGERCAAVWDRLADVAHPRGVMFW